MLHINTTSTASKLTVYYKNLLNEPDLARNGVRTGASTRNWDSYGESVTLSPRPSDDNED